MNPNKMRHCMSLGYSAKSKMANTIGQYGNGFKTSSMRLGADVIVFSSCKGDGNSASPVRCSPSPRRSLSPRKKSPPKVESPDLRSPNGRSPTPRSASPRVRPAVSRSPSPRRNSDVDAIAEQPANGSYPNRHWKTFRASDSVTKHKQFADRKRTYDVQGVNTISPI